MSAWKNENGKILTTHSQSWVNGTVPNLERHRQHRCISSKFSIRQQMKRYDSKRRQKACRSCELFDPVICKIYGTDGSNFRVKFQVLPMMQTSYIRLAVNVQWARTLGDLIKQVILDSTPSKHYDSAGKVHLVYDLNLYLWPRKPFQQCPFIWWIFCGMFHWNRSTKYEDITSREMGVNGQRTDGHRRDSPKT